MRPRYAVIDEAALWAVAPDCSYEALEKRYKSLRHDRHSALGKSALGPLADGYNLIARGQSLSSTQFIGVTVTPDTHAGSSAKPSVRIIGKRVRSESVWQPVGWAEPTYLQWRQTNPDRLDLLCDTFDRGQLLGVATVTSTDSEPMSVEVAEAQLLTVAQALSLNQP